MSKLYDEYTKIRKEYEEETLVAFQIGDAFEFFNEDADKVAEILGIEVGLRQIGKSLRVPMAQVPVGDANKVFGQILESGYTVAVCEQVFQEDGTSVVVEQKELSQQTQEQRESEPEPKLESAVEKKVREAAEKALNQAFGMGNDPSMQETHTQKRTHVVQPPSNAEPLGGETTCVRCGKPLKKESSIEIGMGDTCQGHAKLLGDKTMEQHYDELNLEELTDDWLPLKEIIAAANEIGISTHRMVVATGGDRALRRPVHPSFQVKYFLGKRYVHKSALENLEEARLK